VLAAAHFPIRASAAAEGKGMLARVIPAPTFAANIAANAF